MKWPAILFVALLAAVLVFGCIGAKKYADEETTEEEEEETQAEDVEEAEKEVPTEEEDISVKDLDGPDLTSEDDFDLGEVI